jgi:23S rRNA G2069 N7-methylase RlmK/C1962 C5-methylase RlmI
VVASKMAPVASITMKQAPNWRVATIHKSIIGLRRLTSHGIISTNASAEMAANVTMKRDVLSRITEFKTEVPTGATIEERFTSAAITLLHWGMDSDRIELMRLAVAEARRFPDLAATVVRKARESAC